MFGVAGSDRDRHLDQMKNLAKNYCLLDHHLQLRPDLISRMTQEENARLAQRENAENPGPVDETIPDYSKVSIF